MSAHIITSCRQESAGATSNSNHALLTELPLSFAWLNLAYLDDSLFIFQRKNRAPAIQQTSMRNISWESACTMSEGPHGGKYLKKVLAEANAAALR